MMLEIRRLKVIIKISCIDLTFLYDFNESHIVSTFKTCKCLSYISISRKHDVIGTTLMKFSVIQNIFNEFLITLSIITNL